MNVIMLPTSVGGALRQVIRDGCPLWQLRCPGCGTWADIDDDQLHGRVTVDHTNQEGCWYHETHDFAALAGMR